MKFFILTRVKQTKWNKGLKPSLEHNSEKLPSLKRENWKISYTYVHSMIAQESERDRDEAIMLSE